MKPRRLADLRRLADEAEAAFLRGDWWDGKGWRDKDDSPRHAANERPEYKDAIDVLAELNRAMVGDSDEPDSPERLRAAGRFGQSVRAKDYSASTESEVEANEIFKAAQPYLRKKPFRNRPGFSDEPAQRTAWSALARYLSQPEQLNKEITPNRLRMICRARGAP